MAETNQKTDGYVRFCPGEERIKISDAICFGRRRSNFPKCKGCQFNDDEKKAAKLGDRRSESGRTEVERIESLFGAYDLRGTYPDPLDPEIAWRLGLATAQFLRSQLRGYDRSDRTKSTVVVGRDMRKSGAALAESFMEGLRAGGSPVVDIGLIDTPQLYFAVNRIVCCGGVQVTASHNPPNYNGFKICGQKGKPISSDTGLMQICKIAQNTIRHAGGGQVAESRQEDLSQPYRTFVRGFLTTSGGCFNSERPLKVVVDASNGMAGRWLPLLFGDLEWLDIVRLNFEHNGEFLHDPNPLVEANLDQLKERMGRAKADLGVCFDGDADRLIAVDERGNTVPADLITALLARKFLQQSPGSVVVYDLRSSRVVAEEVREAGGVPRRERCGHAFIKKMLADCKGVFAGEVSGHYYFRENYYCDSAMIAFAEILNVLAETGQPISELVAPLKRYAGSGERNFRNDDPRGTIKRLAAQYSSGDIDYLDGVTIQFSDWWFNVRPSNTEPLLRLNIEAANPDLLERKLAELCPLMGTPVLD